MQSKATSVESYLKELPADRREAILTVRDIILKNIQPGFEEGMQYGMIGYFIPHSIYPAGYHCDPKQPLPYVNLASQKNYMSLYLMSCYSDGEEQDWFRDQFAKAGKKLDAGKCCVRFKKLEDLPLEVIAEAIRRVTVQKHIAHYESAIQSNAKSKVSRVEPTGAKRPSKSTVTDVQKVATGSTSVPTKKAARTSVAKKTAANKAPIKKSTPKKTAR